MTQAFAQAGIALTALIDKKAATARHWAEQVSAKRGGSDFDLIGQDTQALLICVPDDEIAAVDQGLRKTLPGLNLKACAHTSGALPARTMETLSGFGVPVASMHPLLSFAAHEPAPPLGDACFALEGDPSAVALFESLVRRIGGIPVVIPSESKTAYHTAAVFASNFQPVLLRIALDLLCEADQTPERWRRLVAPLMRQSLENCLKLGPTEALTGPVARADAQTVQLHLEHLLENYPSIAPAYRLLSLMALELALEKGLSDEKVEALQRILMT